MPVYPIHTVPEEARRRHLHLWDHRYTAVSCPESAGNRTPVLWKSRLPLNCQVISPASVFIHLKDCRRKNKCVTENRRYVVQLSIA